MYRSAYNLAQPLVRSNLPRRSPVWRLGAIATLVALVSLLAACNRSHTQADIAYVAAQQVNMRDRIAALYNKTGTLKNGERVQVLETNRRFVRVKNAAGQVGWVEQRYLVGPDVYRQLQEQAQANRNIPVQAKGDARSSLRMHLTPGRDTPSLIELTSGEKIDILKRTAVQKPGATIVPRPAAQKDPDDSGPPMEDWLFVRDHAGNAGWVLARMIDVDLPLDVAQYSEGQRIVSYFVLNRVHDDDAPPANNLDDETQSGPRDVGQYLVLYTDPKDGLPYDYNQVRVFTWNLKRHHYETAYRERNLFGLFPTTVGTEDFGREGVEPVFTLRVKGKDGKEDLRKYRLIGPIIRRVLTPAQQAAEQAQKAARKTRRR